MANIIKDFDKKLIAAHNKLEAIERRELWALEGSERRAIVAASVTGGIQVARSKSSGSAARTIEQTWANAAQRLREEIRATQAAKDSAIRDAAAAKAGKKGWF